MDVMKMENIVPREGILPPTLALQASVLAIPLLRLTDVTILPTATCLSVYLPERLVQTTTLVMLHTRSSVPTEVLCLWFDSAGHRTHDLTNRQQAP